MRSTGAVDEDPFLTLGCLFCRAFGIGSDFDGISSVPIGLEDVSTFIDLTRELLSRGYSEDAVERILGRNVLRVMRAAEETAQKVRLSRGPSEALLRGRSEWK